MALGGLIKNAAREPNACARNRRNAQQMSTAPIELNPTSGKVTLEVFEFGSLPAYGNQGRIIWVVDESKIYVDTGSAWVFILLGG